MEPEVLERKQRAPAPLIDPFGRTINYLRFSVTDRCNLRCFYCMGGDVKFLPRSEVLTLEEMERLCAAFIRLGVRKLRLTGGEPLARHGIMTLVERLGKRLATGELDELTVTTNGTLLASYAADLAAAGVRRINVSLDTLDETRFREITGRSGLDQVLAGIDAAREAGMAVRINTVALAGINDDQYDRMLTWCGAHGCDMALIELMPLSGSGLQNSLNYLSLETVRAQLASRWTLEREYPAHGGPAEYMKVAETGRRVGFIAPISHDFCNNCNRVRLTCTGSLVLCLAREHGIDLRRILREDDSDEYLDAMISVAVTLKPQRHSLAAGAAVYPLTQRMWQVGG